MEPDWSRSKFLPENHGLSKDFKLTNFANLKG